MKLQKNFLNLCDLGTSVLRQILDDGVRMKSELKKYGVGFSSHKNLFCDKILAMIFDKHSTRTRVSFDVAIQQLGGRALLLSGEEMQLGRGETMADTAKVLSRYVDAILIRTTTDERLIELTENSTIPVINGLTNNSHPCQVMADIMTFEEKCGPIKNKTIAWCGDSNNVLNSLIHAGAAFDYKLRIATPVMCKPSKKIMEWATCNNVNLTWNPDPVEAVKNADCVITDTWVSMGSSDNEPDYSIFMPYQVNSSLMAKAKPEAIFMHCLPAHRGQEVTDEVIDGVQSAVFDEAENRLHIQKAILTWCLSDKG